MITSERPRAVRNGRWLRLAARSALALALAAVTLALLLPSQAMPATGVWDKLEHAAAFALLGLLGHAAFPESRHRGWVVGGLIVFGSICEALQAWVPGRMASPADALANGTGVLLAAALAALVRHRVGQRR